MRNSKVTIGGSCHICRVWFSISGIAMALSVFMTVLFGRKSWEVLMMVSGISFTGVSVYAFYLVNKFYGDFADYVSFVLDNNAEYTGGREAILLLTEEQCFSRLNEVTRKDYEAKYLKTEAELHALQNQINPHFLANTLELINSLILSGKPEKAIEVSGALGKMYRYNQNLNSWSTVKEEIEYTLNYLTIMQYRISGLQYSVEIPNDLMHIRFMRVILQPLVENSILHGFETKREDCVISITLTQEDKKNVITVMDNGEGMSPEKLSELREKLDSIIADPSINNNTGSIGLANVIKRLRIEYGTAFQYRIVSVDERGTRISLLLPMEK